MNIAENLQNIKNTLPDNIHLVAVSKTKPVADLLEAYNAGQHIFGENKIQEMTEKWEQMPKDIQWHMIGHLQTNKVKYIAPFVSLIHSVDSLKLLEEINKQAAKNNRVINCLLQIYIANEDTKFGLSAAEATELLASAEFAALQNVRICGLMGMATNTGNREQIAAEFASLKNLFNVFKQKFFSNNAAFTELSMGMSSDYQIALANGATLIRVGSMLFGER